MRLEFYDASDSKIPIDEVLSILYGGLRDVELLDGILAQPSKERYAPHLIIERNRRMEEWKTSRHGITAESGPVEYVVNTVPNPGHDSAAFLLCPPASGADIRMVKRLRNAAVAQNRHNRYSKAIRKGAATPISEREALAINEVLNSSGLPVTYCPAEIWQEGNAEFAVSDFPRPLTGGDAPNGRFSRSICGYAALLREMDILTGIDDDPQCYGLMDVAGREIPSVVSTNPVSWVVAGSREKSENDAKRHLYWDGYMEMHRLYGVFSHSADLGPFSAFKRRTEESAREIKKECGEIFGGEISGIMEGFRKRNPV